MFIDFFVNLILIVFFAVSGIPTTMNNNADIIALLPADSEKIVAADKAAVLSEDGRFLLFNKKADEPQPIASITKLMTALVFLDTKPNWSATYQITAADNIEGGKLHLFSGDTLNLKDLFLTSLIASDNGATMALVHASGLSEEAFVLKMNEKAKALGLANSFFSEPIGLSDKDVSTAREVALLAKEALNDPDISNAVKMSEYRFQTLEGREKFIESTDYLLFDSATNEFTPLGGKTGYTDKAGYCFVGRFQGPRGEDLIAAVLNSPGKNERFKESKQIINWVFENYLKK
ncbi:MAG: D-alanyl-D-alanine carboxypeptidase [Candidatus Falkowbacteria bacterium]|nr:MAG: D-alanyl-D-alanine carboxypeptidase [Candidatus Falkowbacteria bacterium]